MRKPHQSENRVSDTSNITGEYFRRLPHILVKHHIFWYNLGFPNPLIGNQVKHLLIILSLFLLFSSIFISCSKSSDDGSKSTDNTTTSYWTKQLGTSSSDKGRGVTTDSSGNIYVTGSTLGGLDGNTFLGGGLYLFGDIFLVKYSSSGTKQWTKQLGTSSDDLGEGVTTDSSGNIYVTGGTGGGLDGNTSSGGDDIFLVKYNSSGTKQWTKQMGTDDYEKGNGVTTDSSGNIYVTGSTSSSDIVLIKYNSSGTKQWTKTSSGGVGNGSVGNSVSTDSSDNIYVTGETYGGLDGNTNSGGLDIVLIKYNSSGTKQWTKQMGTSSHDFGNGVTTDSSGNIYVTGSTLYTDPVSIDIVLVKYNSSGTKQWTKTSSGGKGNSVSTDSSGNIYVTGDTYGGLDGNTNSGSYDIFLVKYNSSGTKKWTKQLGTSSGDYGNGVTVDSSDNIYVTGYTGGGLDGNTSSGGSDIFLVKYDSSGTKQ
jgi:uncharacterized delta-60 repeat protein